MASKPFLIENPLFRLLFLNWLAGFTAAVIVTAGLLLTDTAGLATLVINSANPVLPVAVLFCGLAITLCSVAMGVAVMRLPLEGSGPMNGKRQRRRPQLLPEKNLDLAPVEVKVRR